MSKIKNKNKDNENNINLIWNKLLKLKGNKNKEWKKNFELLLKQLEKTIWSIIQKRNLSGFNNQELYDEAVLAIIKALDNFDKDKLDKKGTDIKTYLYKYINSYLLTFINKEFKESSIDLEQNNLVNGQILNSKILDKVNAKITIENIKKIIEKGNILTDKEKDFFKLILEGKSDKEIKEIFNFSLEKVRFIKERIFNKIKNNININ